MQMQRPDYLPSWLTEEQLGAILHRGDPLLIIAGPGSGKTEVLSWRVAHFIKAGYARPEQFLVTTFTNKAALELKDRVQRKLEQVGVGDANVELMQISTIHSFCADLLRQHAGRSPFPMGFHILDDAGQLLFVFANRKTLGLDEIVKGRVHDFYSTVLRVFSQATEEQVTPDRLLSYCESGVCACDEKETDLWRERAAIAEAYRRYSVLLLEQRLVDFAFLQQHALNLLSAHPDILRELQDRFTEVLVDEYQDTNVLQGELLDMIVGDKGHVTVVGDDDQSIYRFRGATVKNILERFPKGHPVREEIRLTQNFRSYEQIVEHSQRVIVHNPSRYEKHLFTEKGLCNDVLLVYQETAAEEATQVVDLLQRLHRAGRVRRYGDVAVLLRSVRSYREPYVNALALAGVPYVVTRDGSFFDLDYIAQLRDLLTFLGATKPWGDKFVRGETVGLGKETREVLRGFKADLSTVGSADALSDIGITGADDCRVLLDLLSLKKRVQNRQYESLLQVFYGLLAAVGNFGRYQREGDMAKLCNLGLLSKLVADFDELGATRNYYQFLEYLKLLREGGLDPVPAEREDAVQIMTIHQAKGLEFPVVVLGAAMNGRLPSQHRKDPYAIPADMCASGPPEVSDPHLVDERKLFYVAATRAQDLLVVATANVVNKRGGGPSPFVTEMFGDDLPAATSWTEERIKSIESHGGPPQEPRQRLSYSQLAYFLQCPLRYEYSVVYGMVSALPEVTYFGANVHRVLQALHRRAQEGMLPTEELVEGIIDRIWVAGLAGENAEEQARKRHAVEWIQRYVREHRRDFDRVVAVERDFSCSLQENVLVGKIDLVREEPGGGVEIVDFKASHSSPAALECTDTQLDFYALGAEKELGYDVRRQTVHFLGDDKVESWPWSAEKASAARQGLTEVLDKIVHREFAPRTEYCRRCTEFNAICPYAAA